MTDMTGLDRRTLLKLGSLLGAGLALPALADNATPGTRGPGRLLIRDATVLSMDPGIGDLEGADVLIDDGAIKAVGKQLQGNGAAELDATGMILIPGLVDGHWHLWNSLLRSSAPKPGGPPFFKSQLASSKRFTPALTALGVRLGLAEAINAGITTVNSWAHNLRGPAFAQAELQALRDSGLRARLWYGYAQDLPATAAMDFKDIERVQAQLRSPDYRRLDLGLAIRGPERTEASLWQDEFAYAKARHLPVSTHIAVSRQMQQKRAVQQLAERGLLTPSVQLVHATHADADDIRSISISGASVCITPLTEMRVGYGLAPVAALHEARIPVSLGIDTLVLSGNANPYMLMQTALNLAIGMTGDEQRMSARDVLHWATQGAADAMGLGEQIGSISPGKRADLVLIDSRRLGLFPVADPVASVVQSATPADVDTVIADGRVIKRAGKMLGLDVAALAVEAKAGLRELRQ
ncbi:MAG TPA: amidohydrolase family protein [Pseudomonas sp.]|uniref:amidohydrolase family protein n=1 Tax=Pseudomonas sp. TaxID=306 RepID=UPI002B49A08B|nr:amidohydrolase family protein [Pseudomonas sp.]HKS11822.1 amidohydrolase family protein [Pseudomonas sp.]